MEITLGGHFDTPETVQLGEQCGVHDHTSWVPVNTHHIWPKGLGGPNTDDNKIILCTNGHYEVHAYIELLMKYNGKIPNPIRIHFGLKVRNLALLGWARAGKPTHGGGE
jgi:hypothetical protein